MILLFISDGKREFIGWGVQALGGSQLGFLLDNFPWSFYRLIQLAGDPDLTGRITEPYIYSVKQWQEMKSTFRGTEHLLHYTLKVNFVIVNSLHLSEYFFADSTDQPTPLFNQNDTLCPCSDTVHQTAHPCTCIFYLISTFPLTALVLDLSLNFLLWDF